MKKDNNVSQVQTQLDILIYLHKTVYLDESVNEILPEV